MRHVRTAASRREFLVGSLAAAAAMAARAAIKIAHREGNMLPQSSAGVYELAASIGGISGIEVQTVRSNLWDRDVARTYKREANRWGILTVSMGGVMPAGAPLGEPATAGGRRRQANIAAEIPGGPPVPGRDRSPGACIQTRLPEDGRRGIVRSCSGIATETGIGCRRCWG